MGLNERPVANPRIVTQRANDDEPVVIAAEPRGWPRVEPKGRARASPQADAPESPSHPRPNMRVIATVFVAAALVAGRVEASRGLSESPKPTPSPMCETCEEFVTMGEAYLNDPATLNAITDKVNEVCETYAGTKHEAMVRCRPRPHSSLPGRTLARRPTRARV